MNFAVIESTININTGIMNLGMSEKSINAPADTKNNAAKMSLTGLAKTLITARDLDPETRTPAKNAPAATDIPN